MNIGIVGNGPENHIPNLRQYEQIIDIWIGADRGALYLAKNGLPIAHALGDFDSVSKQEEQFIEHHTKQFHTYPAEKDETDLQLAVEKAFIYDINQLYFLGLVEQD